MYNLLLLEMEDDDIFTSPPTTTITTQQITKESIFQKIKEWILKIITWKNVSKVSGILSLMSLVIIFHKFFNLVSYVIQNNTRATIAVYTDESFAEEIDFLYMHILFFFICVSIWLFSTVIYFLKKKKNTVKESNEWENISYINLNEKDIMEAEKIFNLVSNTQKVNDQNYQRTVYYHAFNIWLGKLNVGEVKAFFIKNFKDMNEKIKEKVDSLPIKKGNRRIILGIIASLCLGLVYAINKFKYKRSIKETIDVVYKSIKNHVPFTIVCLSLLSLVVYVLVR